MKKPLLLIILLISLFSFGSQTLHAQVDSGLINKMTDASKNLSNALGTEVIVTDGSKIDTYLGTIIAVILSFAGVIFLVLMIVAGYMWITAQGADDKISKAKTLLTNGIIGLAISFGAFIIINNVISPLTSKYFTPAEFSQSGDGGEQTLIPCDNDAQCADQATRKMCLDSNCLECNSNDSLNENMDCKSYYGQNKPTCDLQNKVCVPNPTMGCGVLNKNTCLAQANCRWNIVTEIREVIADDCYGSRECDYFDGSGKESECLAHGCSWNAVKPEPSLGGTCVNKDTYACSTQCQGETPICHSQLAQPKCVECRDDDDCAGNLMAKKCSVSTGNYICAPF